MKGLLFTLSLIAFITLNSCEKTSTPTPEPEPEPVGPSNNWDRSAEAYLKDSTLYFTKLFSLWQNNIVPANINDLLDSVKVRNITKNYEKAENVLDYLIGMTPKDALGKPIDRFSFLDRQGVVSEEIQNARSTSYGIYVFYLQTQETAQNNADLYIRMVDLNSSAYLAGLRRGDRILSIDGNTKIDYNTQRAQNFKGINDALNSESMKVKWRTPGGQEFEKTINSVQYSINPILSSWVKDIDNNKVGYFAFSSFLSIVNDKNAPTPLQTDFEKLFASFESQGVKHLIVDLRYNGGGSTLTAEYLANKIVPSTATGKRMYYYKLNSFLKQDKEFMKGFAPVDFSKKGNLALSKVYFLVTSSSASASELLINSLKPYMDVQVVGSENTYGKPVGFWGYSIGKEAAAADLYATSFQMFNAANFGDYYNGLAPNKITKENFFKDFGDVEEGFIAEAISHIKTGAYSTGTRSAMTAKDLQRVNNTHLIKSIESNRASDLGMFKFKSKSLKLK